jgi:hypothetical protein
MLMAAGLLFSRQRISAPIVRNGGDTAPPDDRQSNIHVPIAFRSVDVSLVLSDSVSTT